LAPEDALNPAPEFFALTLGLAPLFFVAPVLFFENAHHAQARKEADGDCDHSDHDHSNHLTHEDEQAYRGPVKLRFWPGCFGGSGALFARLEGGGKVLARIHLGGRHVAGQFIALQQRIRMPAGHGDREPHIGFDLVL
jgi:hypothetical protein